MIARRVYSRAGAHEGLHRRDHASHSQELHLDVALVVGWQRCQNLHSCGDVDHNCLSATYKAGK